MGLILNLTRKYVALVMVENDDFYLVIDQRGEGQIIKEVCEVLPDVSVSVFPQTLVVEAVHLGDLPALVVPSEDGDSLPVPYLQM